MQALILSSSTAVVRTLPIPSYASTDLLVRVHAVALNPVDALYVAHPIRQSTLVQDQIVGSDFAGEIVSIGDSVNPAQWKVGDRVAGFVQGVCSTNARPGAFAQYIAVPASLVFRIPNSISYQDAASTPLCVLTAAQGLFLRLGLPTPFSHSYPIHNGTPPTVITLPKTILIYGASTSLGLYVLSLARLLRDPSSGKPYTILGTASTANHALLRSRGVTAVVDYHDPSWPSQICALSPSGLGVHYAFDCISEGESTGRVSDCFVRDQGIDKRIAVIRAVAWNAALVREDVTPLYGAVWQGLGQAVGYNGATLEADPLSFAFTQTFYAWLGQDKEVLPIEPNPVRLMPGGLDRIALDGFVLLGAATVSGRRLGAEERPWMKKISAEKLVYLID